MLAPSALELLLARGAEAAGGTAATVHAFHSRPDLRPPVVEIVHAAHDTAGGYLFVSPSSGPGQRGVLMLDNAGEVVWFHSTAPSTAMNFRAQTYRGEPVLTWWEGKSEHGLGVGECVIVDRGYREVKRFRAGHGRPADLHEFLLTPRDTALVTATETRTLDLRAIGGGARHTVVGSVVQEIDVATGRVLLDWRSLDHVPVAESHQKIGPRFDYFHANSIALDSDGDLVVSARNTWAVYKLDRHTGAIVWRLGGKKSDFAMGKGTFFAWQHDARAHDRGTMISLFDDAGAPFEEPQSRGLEIRLDLQRMRATLEHAYVHQPRMRAKYTGSMQVLGNGDALVGWGSERYFTEFARDGSVRLDARLPPGGQTYRALRFEWSGNPVGEPTAVAGRGMTGPVLYASWNGATAVSHWRLLSGPDASRLQPAAAVPRTGFETTLEGGAAGGYAAAAALDASGREVGRSKTIALG